jgi:UDPglucose 6-dehydrogenase
MYKVSMIGCGKLGLPCAEVMASTYEVYGYDVNSFESTSVKQTSLIEAVKDSKFIFIAVPTPHEARYGGESPIVDLPVKDFDYSIVQTVLKQVNDVAQPDQLVVLISTVLPGTVRTQLRPLITNARFIYNPYLIAMGSVSWDMVNPEMVIIGTNDGSLTGDAKDLIEFYKPLMKNNPRYEVGTWDEAESIKIFYNTFISAKIGLVNMIQDVAEKIGNINVDVVTNALARSTHRITGPSYMKAGLGDAGACHPRDNIALRYLADKLDLGYDLFHAIMGAREIQAENMAKKLVDLAKEHKLDEIWIHGKAYKPNVPYIIGSYSLLIGHYVEKHGYKAQYVDPLTNDLHDKIHGAVLMAHHAPTTYSNVSNNLKQEQKFYCEILPGSVLLDPWRYLDKESVPGCKVIQYGNTRP